MGRSDEADHGVVVPNQWYDDWIKDIPDLTGKVAVVTGANSGTGFWASSALASKGCTVVLACRNETKANHAKDDILKSHKEAKVDVIRLDNMDLSTVRAFCETFNAKYDRLDYLLNNAGIMAQPLIKSKDGFDIQFQTNHLSHFLLTKLLWEKMVASPGQARIVNHSSLAHSLGGPCFDRNRMEKPPYSWGFLGFNVFFQFLFGFMGYKPQDNWLRYGMSKLCNILFTLELASKINEDEKLKDKIIVTACHPGYANTNLQHVAGDSMNGGKWQSSNQSNSQSAADGSLPLLKATVGTDVENGDFIGPKSSMTGPPIKTSVGGNGNDKAMAKELWDYSQECIGESFTV